VSFLSAFPTLVLSLFSSQNDHFLRDSKADKLTHRFCKRYVPPGGFCDSDLFFGAIWFQRVKQYCLLNGIAVMEVNNFVRDGWESWGDIWNGPHFLILVVSLFCLPYACPDPTVEGPPFHQQNAEKGRATPQAATIRRSSLR
jgi:hypothetical protein